ncbi:MAG: glycogen/starch/alpha-glucan phosphorylase [Erysipelotrichaceae bacterium]|nr:glycogen/starch/alpha-glucan phosphorylase [Erysipelotrichaceae bacterium]
MYSSKTEFINDFRKRMEETYGRTVETSDKTEKYMVLGNMIRDYASVNWMKSKEVSGKQNNKQMYYFSMEFLMGRLMTNNLMNLGIYNLVKEALEDLNLDINELEDLETDPGLGNGGLGRLAACFLDSLASTNLPGNGNCIRYEYGLFKQIIDENGNQIEVPDQWLKIGNVWEVRKPKHAVDVSFGGYVTSITDNNGKMHFELHDPENVSAVAYDIPIVGQNTKLTNTLRLWSAEASEKLPYNIDFEKYLANVAAINLNVYPDDSTEQGKILRLKQQYFLVCAGLSSIVKTHMDTYNTLDNFADKVAIQLNDTHPVLAIPELMRVLMDIYGYEWDDAWEITVNTMAYTNHTVLSEALERWDTDLVQKLLPRIYMIIDEINRRFVSEIRQFYPGNYDMENRVSIIKDKQLHMANLAIIGSHSTNGVARMHSELIKNELFRDFAYIWPEKFNNKTNGITPRRWLLYSNPQLTEFLDERIGTGYKTDFDQIIKLMDFVDDKKSQEDFLKVKHERKVILANYIEKVTGIEVDTNSIFDTQAKRLHAYKRQLLNVLHIIMLYQRIQQDPGFRITPRTFIFAAKAAPSYTFAKKVIKLINNMASVINSDPYVRNMIKVVFIPNHSVSLAEILMSASDVSEQISLAGKEASGTGNMKFMMNGAITLGTLDGANVEIDELVGRDNDQIFGLTVDEVRNLSHRYNAFDYYHGNYHLKRAVDSLIDGTWSNDTNDFKEIYDELLIKNDEYFLFADFDSYVNAQREIERKYNDKENWAKSCLINIAKSGFFSSDRTIKQYAEDIWDIEPIKVG